MGFRPFRFQTETYYHIYNRGCNKQQLFFHEKDFDRFGNILSRYLIEYSSINIHVWSFLPNHFHFLLSETGLDKESHIPDFMRKVQVSYAMYFNARYGDKIKQGKKAPVFEGRFKAKEITDEYYLSKVSYYIRHNAVKHQIVEDSHEWIWAGTKHSIGADTVIDSEFDSGFD